ncbi:hypothetical protein M9H77_26650 [Catharanthus roseus]|uniref:Uncharacterized protein n=1 Tax=Catharanthus roseus TaxID=4058 RepID=A0ACC0ACZ8_CATRO|nr:hypothetical protein M9H77_26650 [Catharanthus roseus]
MASSSSLGFDCTPSGPPYRNIHSGKSLRRLQEQMLRDGENSDDMCDFLEGGPDIEEKALVLNRNQQRRTFPAGPQTTYVWIENPQASLVSH